ncbi:MAG: hypothetical protein AAGA12_11640 [Pseudomonadota bacterium]
MVRSLVRVALTVFCLAVSSLGVAAQTAFPAGVPVPSQIIEATFQRFIEVCSLALSEPQTYIDNAPLMNERYASIYQTQDNAHVVVQIRRLSAIESVGIWVTDSGYRVECSAAYHDDDGSLAIATRIPFGSENYSRYAQEIARAVENVVSQQPDARIFGGAYVLNTDVYDPLSVRNPGEDAYYYRAEIEIAGQIREVMIEASINGAHFLVIDRLN